MDGERPLLHEHEVTIEEKIEEQMFLGLRKVEGVPHDAFMTKFEEPMQHYFDKTIDQLKNDKLIEADEQGIRLTRRGRFVGNEVFQQFLMN